MIAASKEAPDTLVLGLDVGSTHVGIALVSCPPATLSRAWPKGKATVLEAAKLDLAGTLAIIESLRGRVDLVVVEPPGVIHHSIRKRGMGAVIGLSTHIFAATKLAGQLLERCRSAALPVVEAPASEWRRALMGKDNATDKEVTNLVGYRLTWGPATNPDLRDAAGCALWGAIREAEKARGRR